MAAVAYHYETLCPIGSFSPEPTAVASSSDVHPATLSGEPEPYEVFRNEISLSTLDSSAPQTASVDYFSLDVTADAAQELTTPPPRSASRVEDEKKPELALESGWFRSNRKFKSPMLQLHKEILDFCEFLSPTPEEETLRNSAIDSVFEVIKYIWPTCRVEVFGSFRTGLYLPSSDIDVVILGSNIRTPQMGLQALSRALSQRGIAKKIQVIGKARVPIIKFVEKNSDVSFDCSFDLDNGPKAADYIKDAIVKLPPLRPLCLIVKVFLQQRELNEVYSGGIGSYALLVMLIAMLRNKTWESYCRISVVATDDDKIAECCRGFGADVVMTSESCRNGTERCNEALQKLQKKYDVVVNIQGDEPLIDPEIVDGIVKALQDSPDAVFSTAVTI